MSPSSIPPHIDTAYNQYETLLAHVLQAGITKSDRTGVGTKSIFGYQMRFDLNQGFPLITTKKIHTKSVIVELLWFLRGGCNVRWLQQYGVSIWDAWADTNGDLGPVYGTQWRSWPAPDNKHIDQIQNVLWQLRNTPDSRRILVSAWNVAELDSMALMPCHVLFQFYVTPAQDTGKAKLSCQLYQRSADIFLGLPFNIASYSLLTHMVAQQCNMDLGEFIWTGGDCHLYNNHIQQAQIQLARTPYAFAQLRITRKPDSLFAYTLEDFVFDHYQHHPAIKAPIAV